MNKQILLKIVDEHMRSFREKVEQNDGSGLAALAQSALGGLKAMKGLFMESDKGRAAVEKAQDCLAKMEEAAKKGDRKLTVALLDTLEKAVRDLRGGKDDDGTAGKN